MLNVPVPFPHVGSTAYLDDKDADNRDIIERVRILGAPDAAGEVLISIRSRRYPREIASGNRRVPLSLLRETEQPASPHRSSKPSGRKPKAKAGKPRR